MMKTNNCHIPSYTRVKKKELLVSLLCAIEQLKKKNTFRKQELLSIKVVLGSKRDNSISRQSVNALAIVNSPYLKMAAPNKTRATNRCIPQSAPEMTMVTGP